MARDYRPNNIVVDQSASSGPVSTMRGDIFLSAPGSKCDSHLDIDATFVVQGETDASGCEYIHGCEQCEGKLTNKVDEFGQCDRCPSTAVLQDTRDPDEGSNGPIHKLCPVCRKEITDSQLRRIEDDDGIDNLDDYDAGIVVTGDED